MNHLGVIALALSLCACGGDDAVRVRLTRVVPLDPACGIDPEAVTVRVRALGEFAVGPGSAATQLVADTDTFTIGSFPAATRAVAVEVFGGEAQTAIGRSPDFELGSLDDDALIPVMMVPPNQACEVGGLDHARIGAQAVPLAGGVLLFGGSDGESPVLDVEWFDPSVARFQNRGPELYATPSLGMSGAIATALPDGRVVVTGGPATAWQLYDADAEVGSTEFLPESRAHHAAVALDASRVLLLGGCSSLDDVGACELGRGLSSSSILNVDDQSLELGPNLSQIRVGGRAYDLGGGRIILVGGVDDDGNALTNAERIDVSSMTSELISGAAGISAQLATGSVISAFAEFGQPATGDAATLTLEPLTTASELDSSAARSGATMTPLSDGSLLVVGGDSGASESAIFVPLSGRFVDGIADMGGARAAHTATTLPDGSVLIAGGANGLAEARADAWVYRPRLLGRFSPDDLTLRFSSIEDAAELVVSDSAAFELASDESPRLLVSSSGALGIRPASFALIGGPRYRRGRLSLQAGAEAGLALLFGFESPGSTWQASLQAGQNASLALIENGVVAAMPPCSRAELISPSDLGDLATTHRIELVVAAGTAVVTIDDREVLRCEELDVPLGAFGFGAIGESGTSLRVDTVTAARE